MTEHTDARLTWVLDAIFNHPDAPVEDDPRDHETAAEMRRDPEGEMDRMEDQYEKEMDR